MHTKERVWNIGPYTWFTLEALLGFICMLAAFRLTPASVEQAGYTHVRAVTASFVYSFCLALVAHAFGLHATSNLARRWKVLITTGASVLIAIALTTLFSSFVLYQQIGRIIISICAGLTLVSALTIRLLFYRAVRRTQYRIQVLGPEEFKDHVRSLADSSFQPVVFSDGNSGPLHEVITRDALNLNPQDLAYCLARADGGAQVSTFVAFSERNYQRIPCEYITPEWLFSIDFRRQHPFYHEVKRVSDIILAAAGLILSSPLMLLAMVAVKLESRGPLFYTQKRVGLYQREFSIWKLRTMRVDSETSGPQWAKVNDPRVTRVGRILRLTRLDEVPQFWNILKGEMAFVGPRPERPLFVDKLATTIPYYRQRHLVKPGLTGWAQICYPYGASEKDAREKLSYDFYYIKNSSLALDLQIMLQTIGAVAKGAR